MSPFITLLCSFERAGNILAASLFAWFIWRLCYWILIVVVVCDVAKSLMAFLLIIYNSLDSLISSQHERIFLRHSSSLYLFRVHVVEYCWRWQFRRWWNEEIQVLVSHPMAVSMKARVVVLTLFALLGYLLFVWEVSLFLVFTYLLNVGTKLDLLLFFNCRKSFKLIFFLGPF